WVLLPRSGLVQRPKADVRGPPRLLRRTGASKARTPGRGRRPAGSGAGGRSDRLGGRRSRRRLRAWAAGGGPVSLALSGRPRAKSRPRGSAYRATILPPGTVMDPPGPRAYARRPRGGGA